MKEEKKSYLKRNAGWILILVVISGYVLISGKTGSCPTCVAITQAAGIFPGKTQDEAAPAKQLEVGDLVPSGTVFSGSGEAIEVKSLLARKPTVLIFYRGGWCPFCNRHLSAMVDIIPELDQMGVQLVAISPDRYQILNSKKGLSDLPYQLLSDSSMEWTSKLGIAFQVPDELVGKYLESYNIDLEADSGESHHLLPHPSVFVVDEDGVVQFSHVNENYKVRLDPGKIVDAARKVADSDK